MHLGTDADTGRIIAAMLTGSDACDAAQVGPLLDQLPGSVAAFTADGAYIWDGTYDEVAARHPDAVVVVPPRATAVWSGTADVAPARPDKHLQLVAEQGCMGWWMAFGFSWRALLVEVHVNRLKRVIGCRLHFRMDRRRVPEVAIAIGTLNRMLDLGRSEYVRVA